MCSGHGPIQNRCLIGHESWLLGPGSASPIPTTMNASLSSSLCWLLIGISRIADLVCGRSRHIFLFFMPNSWYSYWFNLDISVVCIGLIVRNRFAIAAILILILSAAFASAATTWFRVFVWLGRNGT